MINTVTIIGCSCLVVLLALRPAARDGRGIIRSLFAWLAGLVLGAFGIYQSVHFLGYAPASSANAYVKFNIDRVRDNKDALPKNVLLVEGGSYGARAINYQRLENELHARGYSVMVLQFCNPGAPHFERLYTLKQFLWCIGKEMRERLNEKNVLLLSEVCRAYDLDPVAQFKQNQYSSRTLAYLQPYTVLQALHASWLCRKFDGGVELAFPLKVELIKHGLMNAFNIGIVRRSEALSLATKSEPVFALNVKAKNYEHQNFKLSALVDELEKITNAPPLDLRWREVIESELKATGLKYHRIFFATPSRNRGDIRHLVLHKQRFPQDPFIYFESDSDFLNSLDGPECWYDDGHLMGPGVESCTSWFAAKIADSGFLVK